MPLIKKSIFHGKVKSFKRGCSSLVAGIACCLTCRLENAKEKFSLITNYIEAEKARLNILAQHITLMVIEGDSDSKFEGLKCIADKVRTDNWDPGKNYNKEIRIIKKIDNIPNDKAIEDLHKALYSKIFDILCNYNFGKIKDWGLIESEQLLLINGIVTNISHEFDKFLISTTDKDFLRYAKVCNVNIDSTENLDEFLAEIFLDIIKCPPHLIFNSLNKTCDEINHSRELIVSQSKSINKLPLTQFSNKKSSSYSKITQAKKEELQEERKISFQEIELR
ncbi:MAG: hypothetical protein JWM09_1221 [Francisellaceae bacterium]|nr:hypothetical protein [Francisellaceae bacterium]